jgi:serine/threonine protein kinase
MIGQLRGGHFRIIRLLGKGGFGETYLAEDLHLPNHPQRVVKKLTPQSQNPSVLQTARRLFETEAQILYQLGTHPQIPQLFAHFEENQEFYLVQEWIEGQDLSHEMIPGQRWHEAQAMKLLREILDVLAFVHQHHVIHRDIKPQNLIRRRSDGKIALIDFGAVRQINPQLAASQTQGSLTVGVGTVGYMPSEQAQGRPRLSSDIYAVGKLVIAALTGIAPEHLPEDPQSGEILWRSQVSVNPQLADSLDKMVRYDFRQRYASATEALQAIDPTQALVAPTLLKTTLSLPPDAPAQNDRVKSRFLRPRELAGLGIAGLVATVTLVMLADPKTGQLPTPTPATLSPAPLGSPAPMPIASAQLLANYLPNKPPFYNLYLGMAYDNFQKLKSVDQMQRSTQLDFRTELTETVEDEQIESITYYFDNDGNQPLYEFIIKYKPDFNLQNYAISKYGSPNFQKEWSFKSNEGFDIRVWTFESKLVIAGLIAGTEYNSNPP